jgi:hypothetical protein
MEDTPDSRLRLWPVSRLEYGLKRLQNEEGRRATYCKKSLGAMCFWCRYALRKSSERTTISGWKVRRRRTEEDKSESGKLGMNATKCE